MDKVWVEVCGDNDPAGPAGWPKRVLQYAEDGPEPEKICADALNMTTDEYDHYCRQRRPAYLIWEKEGPTVQPRIQTFISQPSPGDKQNSISSETVMKRQRGRPRKENSDE